MTSLPKYRLTDEMSRNLNEKKHQFKIIVNIQVKFPSATYGIQIEINKVINFIAIRWARGA